MRTRTIVVLAVAVVFALLWYFVLWRPTQNKVSELQRQQQQARDERSQLQAQLQRLRDLQQQEPKFRAQLARLQDALPGDPRLPDFILQVQESASLAGIDWLTVSPSLPSPFTPQAGSAPPPTAGGQLQAINVAITTTGKYFEVEDFLVRLERLRRAMRIVSISMAPGGATGEPSSGSPTLSVSFSLQMFVLSASATSATGATPAPTAPASPTPSPAGAPTASPAPTPTPAGG